MTDREKLQAIANYMAIGLGPNSPYITPVTNIAFVFCREDPGMAQTAARLYRRGLVENILLTGGIGKDSGPESRAAGAEALHQNNLLREHGVPEERIFVETKATNGAENTRLGIEVIRRLALPHERIILVVHPRNAWRIYAAHTRIARDLDFEAEYQVVLMEGDPFDVGNPAHCKEVVGELLRVADWPAKGWADPQPNLPTELVEWARNYVPPT